MAQLIAWLPGLTFLAALWFLDTFKLVRRGSLAIALMYGALAALACELLHAVLMAAFPLDVRTFARYVAPLSEELVKALFVAALIAARRIGFLVDAAVLGFAVGTGFAVVENGSYLREVGDAPLALWAIRGLGTGVLHGCTTAVAAIVGKTLADRSRNRTAAALFPGWALAAALHAAYNHLLAWPVVAAVSVLALLPVVVVAVFERSERATRDWLGAGLDLDVELLRLLTSEELHATRFGRYLHELRLRFDGAVVADMFCLLRLELELGVQAKARLMAREAGLELPIDGDLQDALDEWSYLRHSIGPTGLLALEPLRVSSHRDDWHRHLLAQSDVRGRVWRRTRRPAGG